MKIISNLKTRINMKENINLLATNIEELVAITDFAVKNYQVAKNDDNFSTIKVLCPFKLITENQLILMFSTKNLLKNAIMQCVQDSSLIAIDSTYNTNECKYPLIVVGTIDINQKFHLISLFLVSSENEEIFIKIFKSIKQTLGELFNYEFNPRFLLSDGDLAMQKAATQVFELIIPIMC